MKIEEENADKAYNGLVLGPNKPEPVAYTAPLAPTCPEVIITALTGMKQSTLQATVTPVDAPDTTMQYVQQPEQVKNAS